MKPVRQYKVLLFFACTAAAGCGMTSLAGDSEDAAGDSEDTAGDSEDTAAEPGPSCVCENPQVMVPIEKITTAEGRDLRPSTVWTGSEFGIVWSNYREDMDRSDLYFARVGADGRLIGRDMQLTDAPNGSGTPSLAWTGSEFGVAWCDSRVEREGMNIYFARMSPDGSKIGADRRANITPGWALFPSLAWTGSEFAVAWGDLASGDDGLIFFVNFMRLSATGDPVGPEAVIPGSESGFEKYPSMVWTGSNFGVAWAATHFDHGGVFDVSFAVLASDGTRIGDVVKLTNSEDQSSLNPSLAWTGSEFGVAWQEWRDGDYNVEIFMARLSPDGAILAPDIRLTDTEGSSDRLMAHVNIWPALAWNGYEYGLLWIDEWNGDLHLRFACIPADGSPVGSTVTVTERFGWPGNNDFVASIFGNRLSLTWSGSVYGVSWSHDGDSLDISFSTITCD